MKSLETLEQMCSPKKVTEQKKGGEALSPTKLQKAVGSASKKLDLLNELYSEIKALDKKSLNGIKKRIFAILEEFINEGSSSPTGMRIVYKTMEELFDLVDKSRLPQYFDQEIEIMMSSKIEIIKKLYNLYFVFTYDAIFKKKKIFFIMIVRTLRSWESSFISLLVNSVSRH